jgi:Na+/proline symporter
MPEGMVTSLTIITMFTYILSPWYGQKLFAADNAKTAFYGVVIAGIFVTLFYGIAIFSTSQLAQLNIQHLTPDQALPYLFSHRFPMIIKGAGYALLFLIALTTIASLWNTIASIISVHCQQKISIQTNRLITMLIAFLSFILANIFIDQIFNKMVLMNIPIASLSFGLLAGFYWRNCRIIAVVVSIIVGMTGGFGCYYIIGSDQYMWYWAIYIIPLQFFVGIITNLLVTYARH